MALIDDHVASVRQGYERLTAHQALAARQEGALVVDTRTERQQRHFGRIAGAIEIDRTVLEWRLEPTSDDAIPEAMGDPLIIIVCQEGYSSSLAVASLRALGVRATDVIGGHGAWLAAEREHETG